MRIAAVQNVEGWHTKSTDIVYVIHYDFKVIDYYHTEFVQISSIGYGIVAVLLRRYGMLLSFFFRVHGLMHYFRT
jgi:hypothetical protein